MGVYIYTLRANPKPVTAQLGDRTIKVFPWCYAYKMRWSTFQLSNWEKRAAARERLMEYTGSSNWDRLHPEFGAIINNEELKWEGAWIYTELRGGVHYDTEALGKKMLGFLTKPINGVYQVGTETAWIPGTGKIIPKECPISIPFNATRNVMKEGSITWEYNLVLPDGTTTTNKQTAIEAYANAR